MRKWAIDESDQGPVYLGYRLGHIRGESRVFRALIYNKSAMVLHMLRRLVGDEAFFSGLRRFYSDWRFQKAGTDDFRVAMESASRQDLTRFFDAWIYGSTVPRLKFTSSQDTSGSLLVRFEHLGDVLPVPVTVTITYADGQAQHVVVPVAERVVERTLPLRGSMRKVEVNQDHAAVAEFDR
jgi:aminopeptidase N